MRHLRTIGLAVLAALALTALVGTSSASAAKTVLCKTSGSYCASGNEYASGTSLKASSTSVTIKGNLNNNIVCTESTLEGKTSAASGEPLPGEVSAWSLAGCTHYEESCKVETAQHLPYSASFAYGTGGNGTLALKGTGGEAGWHINCAGVNCTFGFQPTLTFEGGNPAHLVANQSMSHSGDFCPTTATFVATYTVSSPQPVYVSTPLEISSESVVLCSQNEDPCGKGNVYPTGTEFSASLETATTATLKMGITGTVKCTGSTFSGKTSAESGAPLSASISSFALQGCTFPENESCGAESQGLPYSTVFSINKINEKSYERMMRMIGMKFSLHCLNWLDCTFQAGWGEFSITNGSPTTLVINQELGRQGAVCPSTSTFVAKYKITSPSSLYVVHSTT